MAFETSMSTKGQVVISKEIRQALKLRPNQKFVETVRGDAVVLRPVPTPGMLGGSLKHLAKGKTVKEINRWIDEGWD
jgi:AbrB family looped-hinge helix DNA binding protein